MGNKDINPQGWLRQFLLLKLLMVLLLPHGAGIPLLVGCMFSLRALLLLCSPHISTKPSTVFLAQLALSDSLVLLQWALRLGTSLAWWMAEEGCELEMGLRKEGESLWWREAVSVLSEQLLDAHHLASLLLLGLLGLEATLVLRWPQQTLRFRTSHWAQLSCSLVWTLVLTELMLSFHSKILLDSRPQTSTQGSQIFYESLESPLSLPPYFPCLRRTLWLVNLWLHYVAFCNKPQRRKSSYH
uniref:G-protein coupled receptors family 1 profile domain-containing protein n=1 Tax=Mastacembelus armatus TaxID=205130 RepID=A0A3Q3MLZ9_9TELE